MKYTRVTANDRINATHNHVADEINFMLSERGILNADYEAIEQLYAERFNDGDDVFDFVQIVEEEIED